MKSLLFVPTLVLTLACGSTNGQLSKREAESDIKQDYPVTVSLRVPSSTSAIKGSPEFAKLVAMSEALTKNGWFMVFRTPRGDREQFEFKLLPSAPKSVITAPKGYEVPTAQAEFVKALKLEPTRDGAKVTYQIRLAKPTEHFELYAQLHKARIGGTTERHATYKKEGRKWILQETDEVYKKKD
ncbi:hypothetical protein [Holophaga foetida]|uniref:hypothetical protein n=1 Tax=Holophaga foetida TaxID=35839 RepID=UPI0002473318|nr:hypothetical protein [Holophaga foetida]